MKYFKRIYKSLSGIRLFYTCHNLPEKMLPRGSEEREAADFLIKKCGLRMIALHDDMRRELNEMFSTNNSVVIHNGVDLERFQTIGIARSELRKQYDLPEDAFVLGNIGRMTDQKNQCFLVHILSELRARGIRAYLLLIGSGPLEQEIRVTAEELQMSPYVKILSHRTDIPELLRSMDVFVFPSVFEGLSVTMVEAQAAGLRCVISDRINRETILLPTTVVVPLEAPAKQWADVILDPLIMTSEYGDLDRFDMKRALKDLERLYRAED